jgi:iron complex outermembrane receptor protein
MRKLIITGFISVFVLFNTFSQINTSGKLKGTVSDEKNKPVEFVSVTIQGLGLSISTDNKGYYEFQNVSPGKYILTFKRSGYKSKTLEVQFADKDVSWDVSLSESLIETPVIDVTGTFNATEISKSSFSITELNSRNITKTRSQTLAETIQNIPGINNISTGVSLGKPVIRGLSFQSVLIVHDGVKLESQMWGDEHGPEISIFDLDRIEILRGPASLIYGADGIGGVVNVISKPLEFSGKNKPIVYGEAVLGGFSVNNQGLGNLTLGLGTQNFGLKGHFGYRNAGNTKTPDGAFEVPSLSGTRTIEGGELSNSGSTELEGGANLGFNSKSGIINVGFETMNREVQLHDDPLESPGGTGNQKLNSNQFSFQSVFNLSKTLKLEPVFSYQMQQRREYESKEDKDANLTALDLKINTFDGTVHLHHDLTKNISGTLGASFTNQSNESVAEEKLIPNYNANTFGIYLLEKLNTKYVTFSLGGRFDTKKLSVKETVFETDSLGNPSRTLMPQDINFNAVTGSFGLVYAPDKYVNIF